MMAVPQPIYLGVTAPITLASPTPLDLELTESLQKTLRGTGFFENEDEGVTRELVLAQLNKLVKEFVMKVGRQKGFHEEYVREAGGKIFTYGSYRLGVHSKGADIDTLCVAPQHVDRGDFFTTLYEMLSSSSEVTDLTQVPDAYVPLIKMKYSGISIDLVFARLPYVSIPDDLDLLDHNLLRNLDERCMLSLNGSRTTDEILHLVPNVEAFHTALRCIKLWAKNRGLYNNAMGYIAGVACALLVARICQLYPNSAPSTIVSRFFRIYSQWKWPQPVLLKHMEDHSLQMKVWNPRIYPSDRHHKMPIITPAYPGMCSTHNVTSSTLAVMTAEFIRGGEIMMKIENKTATWEDLLAKSDFFYRYKHYIQIIVVAESQETHRMWSGYMESKIRMLTSKLEFVHHVAAAPPYTESFKVEIEGKSWEDVLSAHFYVASEENGAAESQDPGVLETAKPQASPEEPSVKKVIYSTAFYIGIAVAPPDPANKGPRRLILDGPVSEFNFFVSSWERLAPDMHHVVRDIRRENLPDYVFEGATRPSRLRRPRIKPESLQSADPSNPSPSHSSQCPMKIGSVESLGKRSHESLEGVDAASITESATA